ncbi:hypothetical protein GGF32_001844 [Allomyces javanicus]|nr:hypothetical protein GGF32_001844 [Allomyces javanicus]
MDQTDAPDRSSRLEPADGAGANDALITALGAVRVAHPLPAHDADDHDDHDDHSDDEHAHEDDDATTTAVGAEEIVDESIFLADVPDDCPELDLTHCRLRDMAALGLGRLTQLERLGMRQNLFAHIEGIDGLAGNLRELDLYDNRIAKIHALAAFEKLETLDLSFNKIKRIPKGVFDKLSDLTDLYFVANKISTIEHLDGLTSLRNLELGANRIRTIENLDHLTNLTQLWLGKNKITSLTGLSALQNLTLLSIQSNRIVDLTGLENLPNLEELYMSHNGVLELAHLENNSKLRVLDVCNNRISKLENIAHLVNLEELWISYNHLDDWDAVEAQTKDLAKLETIYLEGNPLQKSAGASYRTRVKVLIPWIKQIDATFVRN